MLIDSHAHLTFPEFAQDLDGLLARAAAAGVGRVISIGTSLESSRRACALAESHPQVFATVGIHPDNALDAPADFLHELRDLAQHPRVAGIGEIGLDYFRRSASQIAAEKGRQAEVFNAQLALAAELGLNVVIHERDSWEDTLELVGPWRGRLRAVFHCFGKSPAHAQAVLEQGHLVSFTGIVTFKNAALVQQTAAALPAGAFMVETDCPYLAPVPFRGKRSEPAHVRATAEFIAALRGQPLAELARETTTAAEGFFRGLAPHACRG